MNTILTPLTLQELTNDIPGYNSTLFVDGYENFGNFTSMGLWVRKKFNFYNPKKLVTYSINISEHRQLIF